MRFIRSNAIALTALVLATTGTGIAASRYIITSTSQIKPRVLREISRRRSTTIVRARNVRPVQSISTSTGEGVRVPLRHAIWTQRADEVDEFVGEVKVALPSAAQCSPPPRKGAIPGTGVVYVNVLDSNAEGDAAQASFQPGETPGPARQRIELPSLYEPRELTPRKLEARAFDNCAGAHATITSVSIDVIGIR